jgi:hypothetical protein
MNQSQRAQSFFEKKFKHQAIAFKLALRETQNQPKCYALKPACEKIRN